MSPDTIMGPPETPYSVRDAESGASAPSLAICHPRYSVQVNGCSSKVYSVISNDQNHLYAKLLGSRFAMSGHPRQGPEGLDAVKRMKQNWEVGDVTYGFVQLSSPSTIMDGYTEVVLEEGVEVGVPYSG